MNKTAIKSNAKYSYMQLKTTRLKTNFYEIYKNGL